MQIQLKQAEISKALHQYVASQGISLSGKTVTIDFTAGRKSTGLTADISIEDAEPEVSLNYTASVTTVKPEEQPQADQPAEDTTLAAVEEPATVVSTKPSLFS